MRKASASDCRKSHKNNNAQIKQYISLGKKTFKASSFEGFWHCFVLFLPSRSTFVRLRGKEKNILQLSQQSASLSKKYFRQAVRSTQCTPYFFVFLMRCKEQCRNHSEKGSIKPFYSAEENVIVKTRSCVYHHLWSVNKLLYKAE